MTRYQNSLVKLPYSYRDIKNITLQIIENYLREKNVNPKTIRKVQKLALQRINKWLREPKGRKIIVEMLANPNLIFNLVDNLLVIWWNRTHK